MTVDLNDNTPSDPASSPGVPDDAARADAEPTQVAPLDALLVGRPQADRDPLVQALAVAIAAIVVLTLLTVGYALMTGVLGTGAPRTASQRAIFASEARIESGSKVLADWTDYILALIEDGQYSKAEAWIEKGKATLEEQEISADMLCMQAELDAARGNLDEALATADQAMEIIKDAYEAAKAEMKKTGVPKREAATGLIENYWDLLLLKAEVLEKKGDWKQALTTYNEYLASQTTAATVFAQRGAVKERLGDISGAEADYRTTLKFISDNQEALKGLQRIGAAK